MVKLLARKHAEWATCLDAIKQLNKIKLDRGK